MKLAKRYCYSGAIIFRSSQSVYLLLQGDMQ